MIIDQNSAMNATIKNRIKREFFDTFLPHPKTLTSWYKHVDGTEDGTPGFNEESFKFLKSLVD